VKNKKYQDIKNRLDKFKSKKPANKSRPNTNLAFNIAVEIVSGVLVGLLVGLFFDNLFDSKPIFLIICIIMSIFAAFKSIWSKYINNNGS
jgi:ATP synthase protein I